MSALIATKSIFHVSSKLFTLWVFTGRLMNYGDQRFLFCGTWTARKKIPDKEHHLARIQDISSPVELQKGYQTNFGDAKKS